MASKNQVVPSSVNVEDDLPSLEEPDEFNTDLPDYEPGHTTVVTMSWEELNDITGDSSTDEQEWQRINPPMRIDYTKRDKWEFNIKDDPNNGTRKDYYIAGNDSEPGDFASSGRTYLNFRGYCEPLMYQGHVYTPLFTMRLSPDKREKEGRDGKMVPDSAYKIFLEVCNAHLAYHGETLDKRRKGFMQALVDFVVNDSFKINHYNGDNGPFVTRVKPAMRQR